VIAEHGTAKRYEYGCRCKDCRNAHRIKQRRHRLNRVIRGALNPALIPHGSRAGYGGWGCRCDRCKEAERRYYVNRRDDAQ
jgi:hypothetical protein